MKFQRKRGVSVIIATLLLIAITVSAAIIVYVFVGGLAGNLTQNGGQPVTEKLTIQSYNFALSPGACACAQQVLELFLLNPGPAITKISAVYFDGALMTLSTPFTGSAALSGLNDNAYTAPSTTLVNDFTTAACTATAGPAEDICFTSTTPDITYSVTSVGQVVITFSSAVAYGSGHTVKVVSSTGAVNVFTVVSGISG
jgi:flagellin-like protein